SDGFNHSPTPPHFRAGDEHSCASSGRFMVGCRKGVNTQARITRKILCLLPFYDRPRPHPLATSGAILLSGAMASPPGGYSSMVEQQPSKLNTRVRFPLPAPKFPIESLLFLDVAKRAHQAHFRESIGQRTAPLDALPGDPQPMA